MMMNDSRDIRHRYLVVYFLIVAVLATLILVFFVLLPMRSERRSVQRDINRVESEMTALIKTSSQYPLEVQVDLAKAGNRELKDEWRILKERVDTFNGSTPFAEALSGRIDFKVALYDARTMLRERAARRNVRLPEDLGMQETIDDAEDTEVRLWQLATVIKLMEHSIDLGMPVIESIEPMRPGEYRVPMDEEILVREFPVKVAVRCPFDRLLAFVDKLLEQDSFFALRRFSVERVKKTEDDCLVMTAVCGGELFQDKLNGDEIMVNTEGGIRPQSNDVGVVEEARP